MEVFSEAAASPTEGPVEEPDLEKGCNDEHIQVVVENVPPELDLDQRSTAEKFIRDRAVLFSKSDYDIGRTNLVQYVIDTGIHQPFKQPLRRHLLAHLEIIDKHVSEMLRNNVIEPGIKRGTGVQRKRTSEVLCEISSAQPSHLQGFVSVTKDRNLSEFTGRIEVLQQPGLPVRVLAGSD